MRRWPEDSGGHLDDIRARRRTLLQGRCDLVTGSGCVFPPNGPGHFYPYFTQARVGGQGVWEFGNMQNGNTFGKDAQYGSVGPGTIGALAGPIRVTPNC